MKSNQVGRTVGRGLLSLVALVLIFGACSTEADGSGSRANTSRHSLFGIKGINAIANGSDAGIIGSIIEVKQPVTFDAVLPREPDVPSRTVSQTTQDVVVEIQEVKFANPGITLSPGQRITLVMQTTDQDLTTGCGQVIKARDHNGELAVGKQVLALLQYYPEGPGPNGVRKDIWTLSWGWQSIWTLQGPQATSVDPHRNAPVAALLERLMQERQPANRGEPSPDRPGGFRGKPERDPGTEENPLLPATANPSQSQRCAAAPVEPPSK